MGLGFCGAGLHPKKLGVRKAGVLAEKVGSWGGWRNLKRELVGGIGGGSQPQAFT